MVKDHQHPAALRFTCFDVCDDGCLVEATAGNRPATVRPCQVANGLRMVTQRLNTAYSIVGRLQAAPDANTGAGIC